MVDINIMINLIVEMLNRNLFGVDIYRYILMIFLLILTYPVGKIVNFILNHILIKWAKKTDFKFDDIFVRSLNPTINLFVFAGMFYYGSLLISEQNFEVIMAKIFNFLLIIPVVFFLIKFSTEIMGYYLKDNKRKGSKLNEAAVDILMQIIRILLFGIGIILILSNMGYNISALLAGLGVGGLAFALAAQDLLKNFFAGISLIFDNTFNKGEWVKFEGNSGYIEQVKLRTTKLRTFDGTILTIPNAMLADNIVENVNKVKRVKIKQTFGLVYSTSSKKIKEAKNIIEKAIKESKKTEKDSYMIWFDEFNSFSLDIKVIYYGNMTYRDWPDFVLFKEDINFKILEEFEKAGIEIAFPTQTIDIKK